MDLIYCAHGNEKYAQIAVNEGFFFGSRLPGQVTHNLYFADQNWKKPEKEKYVELIKKYKPKMATVLDLENEWQLEEVIEWSTSISNFVENIIIIPKVSGIIEKLPRNINNSSIRLGYSIPTKHGGTSVSIDEFFGWPVHLLGGSPSKQMNLFNILDVKSADGNMMLKMASRYCMFWVKETRHTKKHYSDFTTFMNYEGQHFQGKNAGHEAFRRSCKNIMLAWEEITFINKYVESK